MLSGIKVRAFENGVVLEVTQTVCAASYAKNEFENGVVLEVTQTSSDGFPAISQFENGVVLEVTQTGDGDADGDTSV